MLKIIKNILQKFIDDIDSGNCNISKIGHFKELRWYKSDLDTYLANQ